MINIPWLDSKQTEFPDINTALDEPNGLLAAGGQLAPEWLLQAYAKGIFPWFSEGEPILWWSPSPRTIIYINQLHTSKSLRKTLNKKDYKISFDQDFSSVIQACSLPRKDDAGTWISPEIIQAYEQLHALGHAHSVEVWRGGELIGGLYGVALGRMFFGESMFSHQSNGSKIALFHLVEQLKQWHYIAIDCQIYNDHLASLGSIDVPRQEFQNLLEKHVDQIPCHWGSDTER